MFIAGSFTEMYTHGTVREYTVCRRGLNSWHEVLAILKCNYKRICAGACGFIDACMYVSYFIYRRDY